MRRIVLALNSARWLDGYGLLLVLLILAYFNLVLLAIAELVRATALLPGQIAPGAPGALAIYALYLLAAVPLAAHWLRLACRGVLGLVTARDDIAAAPIEGLSLTRPAYPELYALVDELAERVGSPRPDEVVVSPLAECYVAEERRFSFLPDRSLILVVGLPHLAVLTIADVQSILAHELAHFRGGDTRLGVFCGRFLATLAAVNDRGGRLGWWLDPLHWLSSGYARFFLWVLVPFRRGQELRADLASAAACGGPTAATALLKEWLAARQFDAAAAFAFSQIDTDGSDEETVYSHLTRRWRELSPEGQAYLERRLAEEERPGRFDSHPALARRISLLRHQPPLPPCEPLPARLLLHDFADVERQMQDRLVAGLVRSHEQPANLHR